MECILSEFLNSNDTSILNNNLEPNLQDDNVFEVLKIFARMSKFVTPDYETTQYLDQFDKLSDGSVVFIMFAGARAFKNFEKQNEAQASPNIFSSLIPPKFTENKKSYTSVDCEPFVIFKKKDKKPDIAKEWLKIFYKKENYLRFCNSVPIQLIPIFPRLIDEYTKNSQEIDRWEPWFLQAKELIDKKRVRPYFLQEGMQKDVDFLFELHNSQILYDLIMITIADGKVTKEKIIKAENSIKNLINRVSKRK